MRMCQIFLNFSKFCDLRPQNIKLFYQIPHKMCVCMHHENVHLILHKMSKHTNLAATFNGFVAKLTHSNSIKNFFYRQWNFIAAQKVQVNGTVWDIFNDLKSQMIVFLIFRYVKWIQESRMENLISSCNGKTILQVDFLENASLLMQNEIQSARWNHSQATLLIAHARIN